MSECQKGIIDATTRKDLMSNESSVGDISVDEQETVGIAGQVQYIDDANHGN